MKKENKITQSPAEVITDRAKKLNPNNELYWKARGFEERPPNWQDLLENDPKLKG